MRPLPPHRRSTSGEVHVMSPVERKRGRRLAVQLSSWGPWLLPFVVLVALVALRASIVRTIAAGSGAAATATPAAASTTTVQEGLASAGAKVDAVAARPASDGGRPALDKQQQHPTGVGAGVGESGKAGGSAPAQPQQQIRRHCSNTCFKAFDGVCDEGRPATLESAKQDGGDPRVTTSSGTRRSLHEARQQQPHGQQEGQPGRQILAVEGKAEISELLCDLGTDCSDCGPWVGTVPEGWGDAGGPVAWVRATHNTSIFTRLTATPRPFLAAIAHHKADPDVSAMIWHYGAMEGGVNRILHAVLDGQCSPGGDAGAEGAGGEAQQGVGGGSAGAPRRRLVVDVGANLGYYTVQAALYGCRVVAFEPIRKFRALLEWSVHAAGVAGLVSVVEAALGDGTEAAAGPAGSAAAGSTAAAATSAAAAVAGGAAGGRVRLVVPRDGSYWGLTSVNGVNVLPHEARETVTAPLTTLDRWEEWAPPGVRPQDLLLLKLDIEGWEAPVLRGGSRLLAHNADNILLEYSPGIFERLNLSDLAPQVGLPSALLSLVSAGFSLAHLPLFTFAAPWPPLPLLQPLPLPAFEEVTEAALRHDVEALEYRKAMEVSPGGCPLPPELTQRFPVWRGCREWMYGTHPKGFRSAFGFNTNVWAARRGSVAAAKHMRLRGSAALFDESQDMRVWTSQARPGTALGLINCTLVGSGHMQLFRCPCPPAAPKECGEEQQLVTRLAGEGKMPFTGNPQGKK